MTATLDDFRKIEMRVGRIVAVDDFPEARNPSYKLAIDFGLQQQRAEGGRASGFIVGLGWYDL